MDPTIQVQFLNDTINQLYYFKERAIQAEKQLLDIKKSQYITQLRFQLEELERETTSKLSLYSFNLERSAELRTNFTRKTELTERAKKRALEIYEYNNGRLEQGYELSSLPPVDSGADLSSFQLPPHPLSSLSQCGFPIRAFPVHAPRFVTFSGDQPSEPTGNTLPDTGSAPPSLAEPMPNFPAGNFPAYLVKPEVEVPGQAFSNHCSLQTPSNSTISPLPPASGPFPQVNITTQPVNGPNPLLKQPIGSFNDMHQIGLHPMSQPLSSILGSTPPVPAHSNYASSEPALSASAPSRPGSSVSASSVPAPSSPNCAFSKPSPPFDDSVKLQELNSAETEILGMLHNQIVQNDAILVHKHEGVPPEPPKMPVEQTPLIHKQDNTSTALRHDNPPKAQKLITKQASKSRDLDDASSLVSSSFNGSMGLDIISPREEIKNDDLRESLPWSQIAAMGADSDGVWKQKKSSRAALPTNTTNKKGNVIDGEKFERMVQSLQEKHQLSRPEVISLLQRFRSLNSQDELAVPSLKELRKGVEKILAKNGSQPTPASLSKRAIIAATNHEEPCANQLCPARLKILKYRTELCLSFQTTGTCYMRPGTCVYAHGERQLKPLPKEELCQRFLEGRCANRRCVYAHGREELKNNKTKVTADDVLKSTQFVNK